jgi:hypothetical protein
MPGTDTERVRFEDHAAGAATVHEVESPRCDGGPAAPAGGLSR